MIPACCAGLAACGHAKGTGTSACAVLNNILQHEGHLTGCNRVKGINFLRFQCLDFIAVTVQDRLDVLEFASEIKDSESYSESDATKAVTTEETIEDCFINGEEHGLCVRSLVHDGEYIIVAGDDEIIALESATEGSVGHVIVSSGIPDDQDLATGQIRLNDQGQLMVCDGSDVIKVYEYKGLNTLQGLCRRQINRILKHRKDKVEDLPIPSNIKKFLLYK